METAAAPGQAVLVATWPRRLRSLHRWRWLELGAFLAILVLAGVLRFHDYTLAPQFSDNADELAWAWAGQSLIQHHNPTSWSFLPAYSNWFPIASSYGRVLPGVHNWLDQPPLFALLVGEAAIRAGQLTPQQVDATAVRLPVIVLSLLSLFLLWRLGRRLVGKPGALLAVLLLAVSPAAVSGARLVESEALLAPILLAVLLLVHRLLTREASRWEWGGLLVLLAAAPLVKVPGITFGLIATFIFFSARRWLAAMVALSGSVIGAGLLAGYGALINWHQFVTTVSVDGSRRQGAEGAFQFITSSAAGWSDSIPVHDAWWILGWFAIGALAFLLPRTSKALYIAWPAVTYAAAMAILAAPQVAGRYGWYRLAVYPLVYLAAAWLIGMLFRRVSVAGLLLAFALPGAMVFNYFGNGSLFTAQNNGLGSPHLAAHPPALVLVLLAAAVVIPALVYLWKRKKSFALLPIVAAGAGLAAIEVVSIGASWSLAQIYRQL